MRTAASRARTLPVLLVVFAGLAALYVVEAWMHHSPWIFFDELDYARNSRQIADLGTQPGAKPYSFEGFYPFLIAPAWLADSVQTGYSAAKVIGAVTMTAAIFPAYGLARALAVSRPLALFAAAGSVAVAAMSLSSSLMTETLAYPYATLCFFLIVKALAVRSPGWIAGTVAASILAPVVRKELAVIPAVLAVAALACAAVPRLGRSRERWAVAIAGSVAVLAFLAWALTLVSTTWSDAVGHPVRLVEYARSGAGSLVVGVAILPAIAGLAALVRPRGEPGMPALRAFTSLVVTAAAGFLLYTAAKGVHFGPLSNPVEERNLIYLVPLLFAGTALWLSRLRVDPAALVASTALVAWLVATVPLNFVPLVPASDAPSLEVLYSIGWSSAGLHGLLLGIVALSLVAIVWLSRASWIFVPAACVLVLSWTLASEVYASRRSADYSTLLAASIPRPFDWIDDATGGQPSLYLGQEILQPSDIWLLSFWNPSLVQTRSLDGTPAAPAYHGIRSTGDILQVTVGKHGALPTDPRIRFLVADQGIIGVGPVVVQAKRWRIYTPPRLQSAALGIYSDGWMGGRSSFTVFSGNVGAVVVTLSRTGWCGKAVPGHVRISVDGVLRRRTIIDGCHTVKETIQTGPLHKLVVSIEPTSSPAALDPSSSDRRQLGAQVLYFSIPHPTP